ncbi:PREDICTED: uncharacterized protein LOC103327233 [Prunus mume]|uniref:Uncharacterized protein LOC103327233 n=1 Tax=Prunus mume TaxID=102107 RepID=A0ABM0NP79_PRUMU|nr:PREDICTED: uncharacterized protein LOC103327233 [Prunus mume]
MAGFSMFLPLGSNSSFNLEKAVCNHGFFMMAPNRWIPSSKTLQRPLRLADSTTCVTVSILHPPNRTSLLVRVRDIQNISYTDQRAILNQVARMLRISERDEMDMGEYQKVHPEAKEKGFGRVFRSPSLFEDLVKCLLLCNCTWSNTLKMARALCELQFELSNNEASARSGQKRKRETSNTWPCKVMNQMDGGILGNFPTSKELAGLDENTLINDHKVLGYRAKLILKLARDVERGTIRLHEFEKALDDMSFNQDQVFRRLKKIKGFGSYACANALMCIGYYQHVPLDTETIRHLQEVRGRKNCDKKTARKYVAEIYDKYAPYQCLAYWLELLDFYESKFGKLSELPSSSYETVSGSRDGAIYKSAVKFL